MKAEAQSGMVKYWALFKLELKNDLSYRMDLAMSIVMKIASPLVMVFVWSVVFLSSHVTQIGSYDLSSMIAYFFSVGLLELVLYTDLPYMMQNDFKRGRIASKLVTPFNYVRLLIASSIFNTLIWAFLVGAPLLAIIVIVFHVALTLQHMALFLAAALIGMVLSLLIDFITGCASVLTNDINGITSFYEIGTSLLGGAIVPLSLFPHYFSGMLYALPFQFMFYVPISELMGTGSFGIQAFLAGVAWLAAFVAIAYLFWRMAFKRLTSAGG